MIYFVALLLFVTQALAQAPQPDAACQAWLATPFGQNFSQCEADFPGLPTRTPANNCTLTQQDFDLLCSDACYETMTQGYDFILTNGTCLPLYEFYFGACNSDADCTNPSLGSRVCIEGVCYTSCTTDNDCNSCESEICDTVGQQQACRSNLTVITGNSTFRGNVYQLLSTCSQNDNDGACALLFSNITDMDMSNVSCDTFSGWGCCLGQMLTSMQFCEFERFTATSIYNCAGANQTCADYPTAQQFCLVNVNNTGNGTTNGTSSGISSGISSSLTGGSGQSSHTGSTGVGGTGGNSAGTIVISWSLLVGLLLITPALS